MGAHYVRLKAHGISDIGLVRTNNEDAWFSSVQNSLFVIADGLGGHQAGEIASKEAIERFVDMFLRNHVRLMQLKNNPDSDRSIISILPSDDILHMMRSIAIQTNTDLFTMAGSHELLKGMGTTLLILYIQEKKAYVCHVGDSRLYLFRKHEGLCQLTCDHLVQYEMTKASLRYKEPIGRQQKGYLTKAIGTQSNVEPDLFGITIQEGDIFLLCSDGLSDMVSNYHIEVTLNMSLTIEQKVRMLISIAKENGGIDNITALLVEAVSLNE